MISYICMNDIVNVWLLYFMSMEERKCVVIVLIEFGKIRVVYVLGGPFEMLCELLEVCLNFACKVLSKYSNVRSLVLAWLHVIELSINEMPLNCVTRIVKVRIYFVLIIEVVSMIVGIVVNNVAEFHSRVVVVNIGRVRISGVVSLQGRCCRNFGRI